jgi:RNA polymerase sigma-70 factor, ECF subfamily
LHADSANDEQLLQLCAQGDERAFQMLYDRHNRMVYNLLFRLLGNHADAEELAPEVFVRVWQKAGNFRGGSRVSTWVYRIASNIALDRLRSAQVKKETFWEELSPQEQEARSGDSPAAGPEESVLRAEEQRLLAQAMALLAPEDRLLVTLYHLQEHSYGDIEEITGISPTNIKSKLFRARQRLKRHLETLEKGDAPDEMPRNSASSTGLRLAAAVQH